ncbi:hypothetical protein ACWEQ7_02845 [Streptomyces sp. NPDC004069]
MSTVRQNPNGSWSPDEPLPLTNDFDAEVYGTGPWRWEAYRGLAKVASGRARTRLGLQFALWRARRHRARHPAHHPTPRRACAEGHTYTGHCEGAGEACAQHPHAPVIGGMCGGCTVIPPSKEA